MKHALSAAVLASAVLVAACSGGGGGSSTTATVPAPLATGSAVPAAGPPIGTRGTISLFIPTSTTAATARRAQFVSSAAVSAVVTINGGSAASYDISASSSNCVPAGTSGRTCTLAIGVPNGTASATVSLTLFTGVAGLGTLLGSGSGSTLIPANATSFNVLLDVSPIVASVTFSLAFASTGISRISLSHVETGTATLTYTDPGGAVIPNTSTSTFLTPITLSVVDPSGTVSIGPATVTNAAQAVTVNYTGGATLGASVTFNATRGATPVGTLLSKTSGFQTNFPLGGNKRPNEIIVGSDGNLWFTEFSNNSIGQMTTAGALTEFPLPNTASSPQPVAIAAGPTGDPHVWYTTPTNGGGGLGVFGSVAVPAGTTTDFSTGGSNNGPYGIRALGSNIWVALQNANKLYISNTAGTQVASSPITLPAGTFAEGLAVGPDGNMWVAGFSNGTILAYGATAPFSPVTIMSVPAGVGSEPAELVAGPDGAIWFTEQIGTGAVSNIGRVPVLPSIGSVTEFPLPAQFSTPWAITVGSDGGIWFAAAGGGQGKIARIDPTTHIIVGYPLMTTTQAAFGLVTGPDGNLWATDFNGSAIVRIQP